MLVLTAGIADLDTGLTNMNGDDFTHFDLERESADKRDENSMLDDNESGRCRDSPTTEKKGRRMRMEPKGRRTIARGLRVQTTPERPRTADLILPHPFRRPSWSVRTPQRHAQRTAENVQKNAFIGHNTSEKVDLRVQARFRQESIICDRRQAPCEPGAPPPALRRDTWIHIQIAVAQSTAPWPLDISAAKFSQDLRQLETRYAAIR